MHRSVRYSRFLLLLALALALGGWPSHARAEEAQAVDAPGAVLEDAEADGPAASVAAGVPMPYDFGQALRFVVQRSETLDSRLNGKEIAYKRRGSGEATLHLQVGLAAERADTLELRMRRLECSTRYAAGVLTIKAGPERMQELADKKVLRSLKADGSDEDRRQLAFLTQAPWYSVRWDGAAWSQARNLARGEAWPLADRYALERELLLLLPVLPEERSARESFERVVVAPYPLPLHPALTSLATYKLARRYEQDGKKRVEYTFLGSIDHAPSSGFSWGGIRLKGSRATGQISGTLSINPETRRLVEGSFSWVLDVRGGKGEDQFLSTWKGKSQWTREE